VVNSQATSVTSLRLHQSAMAACFALRRQICLTAFWDFCNTICQERSFGDFRPNLQQTSSKPPHTGHCSDTKAARRHSAAADFSLVISRLEDFSAKVTKRLDDLDRSGMQDIIRALVRRIEIDDSHIEVIFRVPPPDGPSGPSSTDASGSWQHCTGVGRALHRVAQSPPKARQGLGKSQPKGARILASRLSPPHAQKTLQSGLKSPDRLLDFVTFSSRSRSLRGEEKPWAVA
jgi:hypothetical protein